MDTVAVLNRVLSVVRNSLPMYLGDAAQGLLRSSDVRYVETMQQAVADLQGLAERIAAQIMENGGVVAPGEFPLEYTALHDLSPDYLIRRTIEYYQRDIRTVQACAESLTHAPYARSLAEETLGALKGHLENFEELLAAPTA